MNSLIVAHVFLCVLATLPVTLAKNFTIEIESIPMERESFRRTKASNNRSTNYKTGHKLFVFFCLKQSSTVTLSNVRFSNDGKPDTVSIALDGERLGSFSSVSNTNFGFNWNVFSDSGPIGSEEEWDETQEPGRHILEFTFVTDNYGIEIDAVTLTIGDDTLQESFLRCVPVCDDDINPSNVKARDDIPSAKLVQASYKTFCQKDININYHLYHESVTEFRLTASPHKYRALLNDDIDDNFTCKNDSDVFWEFNNFNLHSNPSQTVANAVLTFAGSSNNREITVTFQFEEDASFTRMSDEDVGAVLTFKIKDPVPSSFTAKLSYSSRNGKQTTVKPTSSVDGTIKWNIPDFTWIQNSTNNVTVTLGVGAGVTPAPTPSVTVTVESFKLERRPKLPDETISIYSDLETKIEAIREDQYWRGDGMVVTRKDQTKIFENITRITVSKVNGFKGGFDEIFQLNHDGIVKIKPTVPIGGNSVPYGSSFIIGQFNASEKRPYAGISTIVIDPFSLIFYLDYINANGAKLEINPKPVNTEVHVSNATFNKDRDIFPIGAVLSTWVSDGNADLDRVSANLNPARPPLDDWQELYGTSFAFFRQCVSLHNTQGPDLVLELLNSDDSEVDQSR